MGGLRARRDTNATKQLDLLCQEEPPTPSEIFEEPHEEEEEGQTTSQAWRHLFCIPHDDASDALGDGGRSDVKMTPDMCGKRCCGAVYFALRGGTECICIGRPGHLVPAATSEDCKLPCGGRCGQDVGQRAERGRLRGGSDCGQGVLQGTEEQHGGLIGFLISSPRS